MQKAKYSEKNTYKQAFPSKGCREKRWERESIEGQGEGQGHRGPDSLHGVRALDPPGLASQRPCTPPNPRSAGPHGVCDCGL